VSAAARRGPITLAEFERMPEDERYRVELVRGRLVREPRPAALHALVTMRLGVLLDAHVAAHGGGVVLADMGFVLATDPETVRGPDIAFVSAGRVPERGFEPGFWHRAPDLAIEVLSPSNRRAEIEEKIADYLGAGTRLVWVVDPAARTVTVHQPGAAARVLGSGDVLDGAPVLAGLRIDVATIFRNPLERR
jgi:Uma2 family endonuclease